MLIFIFASITYVTAFNEIEHNAVNMQKSYIDQSKSVIDRRFRETIDASFQLREFSTIKAFKEKSYASVDKDYYSAVTLYNELQDKWFQNEIIRGYFIFFEKSTIVANPIEVYFYKSFNDEALNIENVSKEQLWEDLFSKYYSGDVLYANKMKYYENSLVGIPVVTTLGHGMDDARAVILMIMDGDKLKNSMTVFAESFHGNFFIVDEQDNMLMSYDTAYGVTEDGSIDYNLLEEDAVMVRTDSDVIPYTYILVQSKEKVFHDIHILRRRAIIGILTMIVLGFSISIWMAKRNSAPVVKLMTRNEQLTERVNHQLPYIKMTFLERLLKGEYSNLEEISAITKLLNTDYTGMHYGVMVIDYDEHMHIFEEDGDRLLQELEMKRVEVKDVIFENKFQSDFVHDIDYDKIAIIFIDRVGDVEAFKKDIQHKTEALGKAMKTSQLTSIRYGVGSICDDIMALPLSLGHAVDALAVSVGSEEGRIIWYESIEENSESYYFPFELENRLYNGVKSGDSQLVTQILRELLKKNLVERNLKIHLMRLFIHDIWGIFNRIRERAIGTNHTINNLIQSAVMEMYDCTDLEKIQLFRNTLLKVTDIYAVERKEKKNAVMDNINAYLRQNLSNPNFSLQDVADEFKLSYKYVSQIFKDYNETCFIHYIQTIRMKKAEELLIDTNMFIGDIVTACGYNSSNSFGKAFKRHHGVSASVFREKNKE